MQKFRIEKRRTLHKLEQEFLKSLQHRITLVKTPAEKRAIVAEVNPLFYAFGQTRKVFKPYLTYEENYHGA